jgi:DNA-binding GntR family transcriptional regulator
MVHLLDGLSILRAFVQARRTPPTSGPLDKADELAKSESTMDSSKLQNSQERAYGYVRDRILDCEYVPGQRLKALEIARLLGLSRTPVKEALSRLEQEGLVQRSGGYGYIVQVVRVAEILHLYRVREVLEVEAALEVMGRITPALLKELGQILDRSKLHLGLAQLDLFLRTNREFYSTIFAATGNSVLCQVLGSLNARIWSVGSMVVKKFPPRADQILLENRRVLKALRAQDQKELVLAVRTHIRAAGDAVQAFVKQEDRHVYFASA